MNKFLNSEKGSDFDGTQSSKNFSQNQSQNRNMEEQLGQIKKGRGLRGLNSKLSLKKMEKDLK